MPSTPDIAAAEASPATPHGMRERLPRPETAVLLLAWLGTLGAKAFTLRIAPPPTAFRELVAGAASDGVFLGLVGLGLLAAGSLAPRPATARVALLLASVCAAWALVNAAWLVTTGTQFQPGVLAAAWTDLGETKRIVLDSIRSDWKRVLPPALVVAGAGAGIVLRLARPRPYAASPALARTRLAVGLCVPMLAAIVARAAAVPEPSIRGEAIAFSSHWLALRHVAPRGGADASTEPMRGRPVPRAGDRVVVPPADDAPRPNVLVILLESVPRAATSLAEPVEVVPHEPTPVLEALRDDGMEVVNAHAIIPHTTKAIWTIFTGLAPDLRSDAVESALVDEPYESLATILGRRGYRSGFFQMSRGAFEGGPGLFANLGFDHAWFRENLEDPSAYVGYMSGDDYRLLEPMRAWIEGGDEPFLLGLITAVSHDPYELPAWTGIAPAANQWDRFRQTVAFTDRFVAEVLGLLDTLGLAERTLVCLMSDHGEVFRPEARRGRWMAFEEAIRVPWLLRLPGTIAPGTRVEGPASQMDVAPTLLDLLGWDVSQAGFDGRSVLRGLPADRRLHFHCWYAGSTSGFIEGDAKYMHIPHARRVVAYDLAADPAELSPRAVGEAEAAAIVADVAAWAAERRIDVPADWYRERLLFGHWRTITTGRATSAYYVRPEEAP